MNNSAKVKIAAIRVRQAMRDKLEQKHSETHIKGKTRIDTTNGYAIIIEDERDIVRIRHDLRKRRCDAKGGPYTTEPDSWITLKSNGEHVPLDENGVAIGGAGGWAKGKSFSNAKRTSKKKAGAGEDKPSGGTTSSVKAELKTAAKKESDNCRDILQKINAARELEGKDIEAERADVEDKLSKTEKKAKSIQKKLDKAEKILEGHKTDKTNDELEKICRDTKTEWMQLETWMMFHEHEADAEEAKKKRERLEAVKKERNEALTELTSRMNVEEFKSDLDKENREVAFLKKKKDLIEQHGQGKSIDSWTFEQEYEEAAKARNEAVLKAFGSASECETSEEVTDYLRAKGFFGDQNKSVLFNDLGVDISKMKPENAKAMGAQAEKFFDDFPFLKGKLSGMDCHDFYEDQKTDHRDFSGTYGYAYGTHLSFAEGFYGNPANVSAKYRNNAKKAYEKDVSSGHHPKGTDFKSVIDHEFTHAMEKVIMEAAKWKGIYFDDGRLSNTVMKRVQEKLYGSYSKAKEQEVRESISNYSGNNRGCQKSWKTGKIKEIASYGRNTEFLAEAMAMARCSDTPNEVALAVRDVMNEIIKEVGLG